MENLISTSKKNKLKLDFKDSKYATGRRKRSIAKVWVKKGSGNIHVNGLKMNEYFKRPVHQIIVTRPLEISEVATNYDVKCSVKGGGLSGQAGAIILGISKALISHDEKLKKILKKITFHLEKIITDPFIIRGIIAGIAVALVSGLVGCFVVCLVGWLIG